MGADGEDGSMTLVFALEALRELADPKAALEGARAWTRAVGAVAEDPRDVLQFTRERDVPQDYFAGRRDRRESLGLIRQRYDTDRHVFVGTDEADRALATELGWEFLFVEEAAAEAGWELADGDDGGGAAGGIVGRLRDRLPL